MNWSEAVVTGSEPYLARFRAILARYPDLDTAWKGCQDPDLMLWLLGRYRAPVTPLIGSAIDVASTSLHLAPPGDGRASDAVEVAERWNGGTVGLLEVGRGFRSAQEARVAYEAAGDMAAHYAAMAAHTLCSAILQSFLGDPTGRRFGRHASSLMVVGQAPGLAVAHAFSRESGEPMSADATKRVHRDHRAKCASILLARYPVPPPVGEAPCNS